MVFALSQMFAFLALIANIISFQKKTKIATLLFVAVANIFMVTSYVFLGDWVGAVFFSVATVRVISFIFLDKYRDSSTDKWLPIMALVFS